MSSIAKPAPIIDLFPKSNAESSRVSPKVLEAIDAATARFKEVLLARAGKLLTSPGDLLKWEQEVQALVPAECIDPVTGAMIKDAIEDPVVQEKAEAVLDTIPDARLQKGNQKVTIRLYGGSTVTVKTPYYLRRPKKKKGRKRGKGRRGKAGNGIYPVLAVLGIHERLTPAFASDVARLLAEGTYDEAERMLARRGVHLNRKTIGRIARTVGRRALAYRRWQIEKGGVRTTGQMSLKGKRLGIYADGGRAKFRLPKKGRRRKKTQRSGFETEWHEPKLFVVYEIDGKGRKRRCGFVRYDATMGDADALFEILVATLREIGAEDAELWVIGGDAAEWIWNRTGTLAERVGYDLKKVIEVIDFWHATGYLSDFAKERSSWTDKDREAWVRRMKRRLKKGAIESIVAEMRPLCHGPNAKAMRTIANRFETHKERMRYQAFRNMKIPCGSGAVESAVRRIVNLRLKGNGIFWKEEMAEIVLHLRSQNLSHRWDDYMCKIFQPKTLWCLDSSLVAELKAA